MKSYHIYLEDKCLFKNLNEEEFDLIWSKIYYSYWREDLTYSVVEDIRVPAIEEASFWSYILWDLLKFMREQLIKALLAHAQGDIQKHVANVEVYLTNPAGIGEHSNIVEAIEQELDMIAKYQDQIDMINKYFKK